MRVTFESVDQAKQTPSPMWAGFIQAIQGPVKTKRLTLLLIRGNSCLTVLSWDRRFSCLWATLGSHARMMESDYL